MRYAMKTMAPALIALFVIMAAPAPVKGAPEKDEQAIFAGWLSSEIEEKVKEELSGPGRKVHSVKAHVPERYRTPEDFDSLDIHIPRQNRRGDRLFVSVSFSRDGEVVSRMNLVTTVRIDMDVVVAARDIDRGKIIGEEDIEVKTMPAGVGYSRYVTDPEKAVGQQVDRDIRAGSRLVKGQLERPKLVRSGDIVTMVADSGAMQITVLGRAQQDGDKGEWIKVVNIDSKKAVNARIIGPGAVMVEF